MVTNDKVIEDVVLYHHVNNGFCKSWSIDGDFDQFIVYPFD